MNDKRPGLGRGLSALLEEIGGPGKPVVGAAPASATPAWTYMPTSRIRPNPTQPRRDFDPEALAELTESLRAHGMLQPILVREAPNGGFELVAGERRWRAAQAVPLHEVPVIIRRLDDSAAFEIALIENIQRSDLNPVEEAQGFQRLIDEFDHTQDSIAKATGKSRSHVANLLRLLKLPDEVLAMLREGELTMGHARALIGRPDALELAERVVEGQLSVRQTEALATDRSPRAPRPAGTAHKADKDADTQALERALSESIGLKVTIEGSGIAGRVVIDYGTLDQLDLIAQRLSGGRF